MPKRPRPGAAAGEPAALRRVDRGGAAPGDGARARSMRPRNGLPGEHHFYLTFRTDHPGVVDPARLRAQYPQEMTIVLQHQFWDLAVDEEAGAASASDCRSAACPRTLVIPLAAVTAFADPYVRYGLRFHADGAGGRRRPTARRRTCGPTANPTPPAGAGASAAPQVVSLDAFRRRTPPKDETEGPPMNAAMRPRPSELPLPPMFPLGAGRRRPGASLTDRRRRAPRPATARTVLRIAPEALSELAFQAFHDVSHLLRPAHLAQLRAILDDPEASANDRFVALDLLKNANIAAGGVLPMCQDTGTAHRVRQEGPARLGRRRRGGGAELRRAPHLHRDQSALFADGAAVDVRGGEHRQQPAGAVRHLWPPRASTTPTSST